MNDDASVVLQDGSKFGRQILDSGESVWTEESADTTNEEDVEPEAAWLVDEAESAGYESADERDAEKPEAADQRIAEATDIGLLPDAPSEGREGEGSKGSQVKAAPTSKMDVKNADSKELFGDDGGFKLGKESTQDGDKIVAARKAKEDAKAAQDAAHRPA